MSPYRLRIDLSRLTLFRIDYLAKIGLTLGFCSAGLPLAVGP